MPNFDTLPLGKLERPMCFALSMGFFEGLSYRGSRISVHNPQSGVLRTDHPNSSESVEGRCVKAQLIDRRNCNAATVALLTAAVSTDLLRGCGKEQQLWVCNAESQQSITAMDSTRSTRVAELDWQANC